MPPQRDTLGFEACDCVVWNSVRAAGSWSLVTWSGGGAYKYASMCSCRVGICYTADHIRVWAATAAITGVTDIGLAPLPGPTLLRLMTLELSVMLCHQTLDLDTVNFSYCRALHQKSH